MECGLGSPEQIGYCIHFGMRWLPVVVDFLGLGSFALISILMWFLLRLRKDIKKWEDESERANELKRYAEDAAKQAEHRAQQAERHAAYLAGELEKLKGAVAAGEDEALGRLVELQAKLSESTNRIDGALELTAGGTKDFWSQPVGNRFAEYGRQISESIPILLFGNQKGGVGKSTLVTNLAAAFSEKGERVLTVDLDYQGSHSSLMQLQAGQGEEEPESLVDILFEEQLDPNWVQLSVRKVQDRLHYIPAFYNFELVERRVEYQWALGIAHDDVRYRLARALLSPEIQNSFDRILIDGPPRFTLGFVNGFCAATHLYVPTVVDGMAGSAVGLFARQFQELKSIVNLQIQWAGIIGTMTFVNPQDTLSLSGRAKDAADAAEREAQNWLKTREPLFIRKPVIKRDADLARATEKGIAYLNDSSVRPMFDALVKVIESKAPSRRNRA